MTRFVPKVYPFKGKFIELPRDHVYAFVVELQNSVVVIDTTLAISSAQGLRKLAESFNKPIECVLMTHGHPDHYSGLDTFRDLPTLASKGTLKFAQEEDIRKAPTATYLLGDDWPKVREFPNQIIPDICSYTFGGIEFNFKDLGPGESDSDGIWSFKSDGVDHVFVGDIVSNHTHNFFKDGHTFEWLEMLTRLEKDYDHHSRFYYGHGEASVGIDQIVWTKGYIRTFIDAVRKLKGTPFPISESIQLELIDEMKSYLTNDALLFLLTYDLKDSVEELMKKL